MTGVIPFDFPCPKGQTQGSFNVSCTMRRSNSTGARNFAKSEYENDLAVFRDFDKEDEGDR